MRMSVAKSRVVCLLASDLHGNIAHYEKLLQVVRDRSVSIVFLGGDLTPKEGGLWSPGNKMRTIKAQAQFINNFLLDYLRRLSKHAYIFGIFGNDDFKANYHMVRGINDKIVFLDKQVAQLPVVQGGLHVAGYPYVRLTPFMQKDWDRWDVPGDVDRYRKNPSVKSVLVEGYKSARDTHYFADFLQPPEARRTIARDLQLLAAKSNPRKTVYLMHDAPYGTSLDMVVSTNPYISGSQHIGSKAIRSFTEKYLPFLTLHGHIHETFQISGSYVWRHKESCALTASHDFTRSPLACTLFDLADPSKAERIVA